MLDADHLVPSAVVWLEVVEALAEPSFGNRVGLVAGLEGDGRVVLGNLPPRPEHGV